MRFAATLFDGKTAAGRPVEIVLIGSARIQVTGDGTVRTLTRDELTIAEQLASQPAVIELPGGERLEIEQSAAFHAAARELLGRRGWLARLESHWAPALGMLAVTALVVWSGITWGVPAIAATAARVVPVEVDAAIGEQGLAMLDRTMLAPTTLTDSRRTELQAVFTDVVGRVGDEHEFRLEFRDGRGLGANALALPSGLVVLTDQLVELAAHDEEIAAVLAHEVGHAVHRHALRAIIQNSLVAGLIVVVTGDVGSVANLAAGIPALLAERSYSRAFEREADDVAYRYLALAGIDEQRFGDLILRLAAAGPGDGIDLLSTHPNAAERAVPR